MITLLEEGLKDFLTARVAAASLGYPVECRPATTKQPLPGDRAVIFAQCADLPQDPPSSTLWLAELLIYVTSDASVKAITADHHGALELLITDAFDQAQASAINAAVSAKLTGYAAESFVRNRWQPARDDTKWAPALSITLAVAKA